MSVIGEHHLSAEQRLQALGMTLPAAPVPLGQYVEAVQVGALLFLSGALPIEAGTVKFVGRVGGEQTLEQGRSAARLATLNALALARAQLGSLDRIARVVRLQVTLATTADFREHARVADAASEVLGDVFGADRAAVRMVTGAVSLPLGASCVIELVLTTVTQRQAT